MNPRIPVLLAVLACASPLAAQGVPHEARLLRVASSPGGIVLSVDSFSIGRTADSTFLVNAVYQFPVDPEGRAPDRREESQEMDCGRTRLRGRHTAYFRGDAPRAVATDPSVPSEEWEPVGAAELPLFQVICEFLLGGFAARLPVVRALDRTPELANPDEVSRALSRAYPPLLRDAGQGGSVELRFRVLADGTVDPATVVVMSSTHPGFDAAARRVALTMRFHPARLDGAPVRAWVVIPVTFYTFGALPPPSRSP